MHALQEHQRFLEEHAQYWNTEHRSQPIWRALTHLISYLVRVVEGGAQLGKGEDMKLTEREVAAFRKRCETSEMEQGSLKGRERVAVVRGRSYM